MDNDNPEELNNSFKIFFLIFLLLVGIFALFYLIMIFYVLIRRYLMKKNQVYIDGDIIMLSGSPIYEDE
jgi:hypothetical protein